MGDARKNGFHAHTAARAEAVGQKGILSFFHQYQSIAEDVSGFSGTFGRRCRSGRALFAFLQIMVEQRREMELLKPDQGMGGGFRAIGIARRNPRAERGI